MIVWVVEKEAGDPQVPFDLIGLAATDELAKKMCVEVEASRTAGRHAKEPELVWEMTPTAALQAKGVGPFHTQYVIYPQEVRES